MIVQVPYDVRRTPLADGWFTVYYDGIGVYQFYSRYQVGR